MNKKHIELLLEVDDVLANAGHHSHSRVRRNIAEVIDGIEQALKQCDVSGNEASSPPAKLYKWHESDHLRRR